MLQRESSPPAGDRENSAELPESDGEIGGNEYRDDESDKLNRDAGDDDEGDDWTEMWWVREIQFALALKRLFLSQNYGSQVLFLSSKYANEDVGRMGNSFADSLAKQGVERSSDLLAFIM